MLRCLFAGALMFICVISASAQTGPAGAAPNSAPLSAAVPNSNVPQVAPGDHWTYEVKDEILGTIKLKRTDIVTDVSKNQIGVRSDIADTGRSSNFVYDPSWNIVREGSFKYSPNDGTGIHLPLTVGAQWKFAIDVVNSSNGQTFRRTGTSRVTGRESITTKAGTFDAFVIETDFTGKSPQDPTILNQTSARTWFNLDVNHWVKRTFVRRQGGHITYNDTLELTDYGHKKQ